MILFFIFLTIFYAVVLILFTLYQFRMQETHYRSRIQKLEETLQRTISQNDDEKKRRQILGENALQALSIINILNKAVVVITPDQKIQYINPYAEKYIDVSPTVGEQYQKVLHWNSGVGTLDYAQFESALKGATEEIAENTTLRCRGTTFPISGTIFPLTQHDADTTFGICVVFEESSENSSRVTEDKAFFSAAAHELRTPITVIRAVIDVIRDQFDHLPSEKIKSMLADVDINTVRLLDLVNDFLSISRIEQGRLEVKKEAFDIIALTDEVIALHMPLAKKQNLYINHEVENHNVGIVIGDPSKAKEILSNLITNAIKYTKQGGITLTHAQMRPNIVTRVTDTGIGIPQQYERLLFTKFAQFDYARTLGTNKSTGLGLYISKQQAKLMQGDLVLEKSEPGSGSTFMFTLPQAPVN